MYVVCAGGTQTTMTKDGLQDFCTRRAGFALPDTNSRRFRRILSTCIHAGNAVMHKDVRERRCQVCNVCCGRGHRLFHTILMHPPHPCGSDSESGDVQRYNVYAGTVIWNFVSFLLLKHDQVQKQVRLL
jgi:hypothetical protein